MYRVMGHVRAPVLLALGFLFGTAITAVAAPPISFQLVRLVDRANDAFMAAVDASGNLSVNGSVAVSNLPTDAGGNLRVSGGTASESRMITVVENISVVDSAIVVSPFVATSDCRRLSLFVVASPTALQNGFVQILLGASHDGAMDMGPFGASTNFTGVDGRTYLFTTYDPPPPFVRIQFIGGQPGVTTVIHKAVIHCTR